MKEITRENIIAERIFSSLSLDKLFYKLPHVLYREFYIIFITDINYKIKR